MKSPALPVTVVIINFRTPDLTERAVRSLRRFYPDIVLLLIDNDSHDGNIHLLRNLLALSPEQTRLIENPSNRHHGPAMNQGLRLAKTPYVLFLDSDCEVLKGGFVESMLKMLIENDRCYAVGKRIFMNDRGFDVIDGPDAHPYIRPICMLVKRESYLSLPPFVRHGAPCLANMRAAAAQGLTLSNFPVEEYVHHEGRGTASRHGYKLGVRGKINHVLNKLGL
jgi:glycosyltransferase involved in cell wall biosynthesis